LHKNCGVKCCKAELAILDNEVEPMYFSDVNAAISYSNIDTEKGESLLHGEEVMKIYGDKASPPNIDNMITSIINMMKDYNMPDEQIEEAIDNFFKMVIFDYLFSNTDRHMSNWGMRIYTEPIRGCEFYSMFDNEEILLFGMMEYTIEELMQLGALEEHVQSKMFSKMKCRDNSNNTFDEVITHLLNGKYRNRVLRIINQFSSEFGEEDLVEILNGFEELSDFRKQGALCTYTTRRRALERIVESCSIDKTPDVLE